MADDLSLLLRVRGDASGAKQATSETRAAIASLRQQGGSDLTALGSIGSNALSGLTNHLNIFSSQSLPSFTNALGQVTQEATAAGESIGAMAGPIGVAFAAAIALEAGVVALTKAFFDLTESTVKWEDDLDDLSQSTGVSVQTLSTLQAIFKSTGGNIESAAASLGIFQAKMLEAQDEGSKTGKLFKSLGIETNDTEQAFRQAFKALADMGEGFRQTATARELFGRSGQAILAAIKETNGNLDEAIAKFKEMGVVLSDEDAKAASEFDKQMGLLSLQMRASTAAIVQESIPALLKALQQLSTLVKENKEVFQDLGTVIGSFVYANIVLATPAFQTLSIALGEIRRKIEDIVGFYERFKAVIQLVAGTVPNVGANAIPAVTTGEAEAGGDLGASGAFPQRSAATGRARAAAAEKLSAGQRLLNQLQDEYNRLVIKGADLDAYARVQLELKKKEYDNIDPKLRSANEVQGLINANLEAAIKGQKELTETNKGYLKVIEQIREGVNRQAAERIELEDRITKEVQNQKDALSELEGHEVTHREAVERYIETARAQAEAIGGVNEQMEIQFEFLRLIADKEDALIAVRKKLSGAQGDAEGIGPSIKQTISPIEQLFRAIHDNLTGGKQTAALAGLDAFTTAFGTLARAVGEVVRNFVLFGSAGTSFRKFAAEVIASVAQMAAVKAVFEVAEGLAALARFYFLGDPKAMAEAITHFKSAATYGIVAGIAAVAGRAVAGSSFANEGAGSGGGGGSSRSGGTSSQSPQPINIGSQRGAPIQHIHFTAEIKTERGFSARVVDAWADDVEGNGRARLVLNRGIKRQE